MKPTIKYDDFAKLDIRIGEVKAVEPVEDADKLLRFIFDLGKGGQREIIAGMRPFFNDSNTLIGKKMPILYNIEPANFRGHISNGMILAADDEGKPVFLTPESEIPNGSIVK